MNKLITILYFAAASGITYGSHITLNTGTLPSSQGWAYEANGYHAGVPESDIFSTDGSVLNLNSMDQPLSYTGGTIMYSKYNIVSTSQPNVLEWTSQLFDYEYIASAGQYHGFSLGFSDGVRIFSAGVSPNAISLIDGADYKRIAVDTTKEHTYRFETTPGSLMYNFYVDGTLQASPYSRAGSSGNYLRFGNGTSGANADVDISALEFKQIPEPATTGLIAVVAGGIFFVRRFFTD